MAIFIPSSIDIFGINPYFFCTIVEPPLAKTPSGFEEFPKTFKSFFPKIFNIFFDKSIKLINFHEDKFIALPFLTFLEINKDPLITSFI